MVESISLDQLRMFVAVVEEGSFSAAGRRLARVQSAVSQAIANAEEQLGVQLFERRGRKASLTAEGKTLLVEARRVLASVDCLVAQAKNMRRGIEAEVSIVCDAIFPMAAFIELCRRFAVKYPDVPLRVGTETLGAVAERVESGDYQLGLVGPEVTLETLEKRHVGTVRMVPVVAPGHLLARYGDTVPMMEARLHVQIVLSERCSSTPMPDVAVVGDRTWRVVDLRTKHEMLRAGLGWGNMPEPMVAEDLQSRRLVRLNLEGWGVDEHLLSVAVVYRRDSQPGPAGGWVIETLPELCG